MQTVPKSITQVKYSKVSIISRASARSSLSDTLQGRLVGRRLGKVPLSQTGNLAPFGATQKGGARSNYDYIKGVGNTNLIGSQTPDQGMAWHRCYHPLKVPDCVPCLTPPERLYCCRQVSLVEGDIFQSPFCIAHCVSSDQALRRGLAREIKRWYPLSWEVKTQDWAVGKVVTQIIDQNRPTERMIFHLVTKQR